MSRVCISSLFRRSPVGESIINQSPSPSIYESVRAREYSIRKAVANTKYIPLQLHVSINVQFNMISDLVLNLRAALDAKCLDMYSIEASVGAIINRLLDNPNPEHIFMITPSKKQEREIFVTLGGVDQLLRFFSKPHGESDARNITPIRILRRSELWNEVLVILREIAFAIPSLSSHVFSKTHIIFLFTLLAHPPIFENAMNLLEEVLASRPDTFSLASIPNFYALLQNFTTRQLAHFFRVLSLVLFEPEDRLMLEGSQVLRSIDLLHLRRDRMARASSIVERNQVVIIEMPGMLHRFVQLTRLLNYGPQLKDIIRHSISSQSPVTSELLIFKSVEWGYYELLDSIASGRDVGNARATNAAQDPPIPLQFGSSECSADADDSDNCASIIPELLAVFTPSRGSAGTDVRSLQGVVKMAVNLGIAHPTPQGEQLLLLPSFRDGAMALDRPPAPPILSDADVLRRQRSIRVNNIPNPRQAREELQFHSMLLVPHQVEIMFVLCTLLSGRRKIDVQCKFADMGLAKVLVKMFERMSWESPPSDGPNPLEHIHGPGCECNPESALRVQFMRLVHNFYDRDFLDNANKALLLSAKEHQLLKSSVCDYRSQNARFIHSVDDRGLLIQIIHALFREPSESVYRFWLSSCLEAYLRGSGRREQLFVARVGALSHVVDHILSSGTRPASNLQTSFDLLGEIVKSNRDTLGMVEAALSSSPESFGRFMDVVMSNLIDSNVFLRSLYLTLEIVSEENADELATSASCASAATFSEEEEFRGYLTHSWVEFAPSPLHQVSISESPLNVEPAGAPEASWSGLSHDLPPLSDDFVHTNIPISPPTDVNSNTGSFFTPPEFPKYSKAKFSQDSSLATSTQALSFSVPTPQDFSSTPATLLLSRSSPPVQSTSRSNMVDNSPQLGLDWNSVKLPVSSGWSLPDSVFRIGVFLSKEREAVLLRLIDTVTVRTVNHENICCLNTALLLLVFAHRRGELGSVLNKIRLLADEKSANAGYGSSQTKSRNSGSNVNDSMPCECKVCDSEHGYECSPKCTCQECPTYDWNLDEDSIDQSMCSFLDDCGDEVGPKRNNKRVAESRPRGVDRPAREVQHVMKNFRELLWFWREYYLRRGRDRLSIEFSSRIPFPYWVSLVDTLCMDDGSPTSILPHPITLPASPYCRAPRTQSMLGALSA